MFKKLTATVFLLCMSVLFCANIFHWTDEAGVRHYSNITPPSGLDASQVDQSRSVLKKITGPENSKYHFTVLKVYDGDTIQVSGLDLIFKVRLAGIDAPEIGYKGRKSQSYSQKSRKHLARLLEKNKVALKSHGLGGYGRQLAEVFVDNKNINLEMIKAGLAEVYQGKKPKNLDTRLYLETEARAKSAKKGMWRQGKSYQSPLQWRKKNPRN
jgi:micrococcal nuclease